MIDVKDLSVEQFFAAIAGLLGELQAMSRPHPSNPTSLTYQYLPALVVPGHGFGSIHDYPKGLMVP